MSWLSHLPGFGGGGFPGLPQIPGLPGLGGIGGQQQGGGLGGTMQMMPYGPGSADPNMTSGLNMQGWLSMLMNQNSAGAGGQQSYIGGQGLI